MARALIAAKQRISPLRAETAALSETEPGIKWETATVMRDELADLEMAGWKLQQIEFAEGSDQ